MSSEKHVLTLYIAGQTQKADRAIENINKYYQEHLQDGYTLEVIDFQLAKGALRGKLYMVVILSFTDVYRSYTADRAVGEKDVINDCIKHIANAWHQDIFTFVVKFN
jgi:hypothetical protein